MPAATNLSSLRTSANPSKVRSTVSFERPNDVTAYAANDVIFQTGAAGYIEFTGVGASGMVHAATIVMGQSVTASLMLLIFDEVPTSFADNAAVALVEQDWDRLVEAIPFADANKQSVAAAVRVYESGAREAAYTSDEGKLYGVLVSPSGFTPAAEVYFSISLHLAVD